MSKLPVHEDQKGAVNAEVKIELPSKKTITSIITNESVDELGIQTGNKFCACFSESSVILELC
jgi:molybdate transport system regulatory protein